MVFGSRMQQLQAQDARLYSTFRFAATLQRVTLLSSLAELQAYQPETTPLVLGEGSNSIFLADYQGEIVRYLAAGVTESVQQEQLLLHVEAGHNWHQLVMKMAGAGWWGLENLALIPGSVGAAPVQNIGAYGVEFADCCVYVDFYHWQQRAVIRLSRADCQFGYRDSIFKQQLAGQGLIVAVGLQLTRHGRAVTRYQGLEQLTADCSPLDVTSAVIALRQSKLPDPAQLANCGSFFKNPLLSASQFQLLKASYPTLPNYPQPDGSYKVAAAWLIEQSGFKGYRLGGVGCYERQPLVLVNYGQGTAVELLALVNAILHKVRQQFGIELEPEVRMMQADE